MSPHTPTLLLFTTSAQTHIFPEIEIDAVRFLDLFLDLFPDIVVDGWKDGKGGHGRRILEGYLSILSAGTKFGEDGGTDIIPSSLCPTLTITTDTGPPRATSTASVVLSAGVSRYFLRVV